MRQITGKPIQIDGIWGPETDEALDAADFEGFKLVFCKWIADDKEVETVDMKDDSLKVLAKAQSYLGTKEIAGDKHSQTILGFWDRIGLGGIDDDETHWCAAFVGAVLEECGFKSTKSGRARSYETWGVAAPSDNPPLGSVVVLSRGSNPKSGHVGFLSEKFSGKIYDHKGNIHLLGGNQSNSVTVSPYHRSRLEAVRVHPSWGVV